MTNPPSKGLTGLGKAISAVLVLGLLALGAFIVIRHMGQTPTPNSNTVNTHVVDVAPNTAKPKSDLDPGDSLAVLKTAVPTLAPGLAYIPKDNILDIELSQYAGYSGFVAANGGLAPNPDSYFTKKYGFQVRLKLSEGEEDSWNALNSGKMAASATTVDVLAVYGRQMQVTMPAQIGYSRGADGLVVHSDIKRFNDLKGKIVAAEQFTESDFFVRYLAHEAGIDVKMLDNLNSPIDPNSINLLYCTTPEAIGALMKKDLDAGTNLIAAGMTWAPVTTDLVASNPGKLKLLTTNKNLLIIADIFIVNRGFAEKNPDKVAGLVDGLLAGNKMVRDNPEQYADLIAKTFSAKDDKWDHARALSELQKVHLSNLPENLAFFSGGMTAGGSCASIYQSAVLAYGPQLLPDPVDADHFIDLAALKKADASGNYKDQTASIVPLASTAAGTIETNPLLSKDIRFFFLPNSDELDLKQKFNLDNLNAIKQLVDVSPGSHILLRGHADDGMVPTFKKQGEDFFRKMSLEAMDLSKRRAAEIKRLLVEKEKVDANRIDTVGRGWEEPAGTDHDANRRVEVQWFTLE